MSFPACCWCPGITFGIMIENVNFAVRGTCRNSPPIIIYCQTSDAIEVPYATSCMQFSCPLELSRLRNVGTCGEEPCEVGIDRGRSGSTIAQANTSTG